MPKHHASPLLAAIIAAVVSTSLIAQTTATTPSVSGSEKALELSPFVVDASKDTGYKAENTLSGSRLNTSLRDTASSVSVFTEQFIQDLGINQIEQLVNYSVGTQVNTQDQNAGSNANAVLTGATLVQRIDVRGIPSSQSLDYFKSITPNDSYRLDRYDESRGPNGILFGIGSAGGLINQTSILATTNRSGGRISHEFNDGATAGSRFELRHNQVIIPKKLALAVAAVDQQFSGWRKPSHFDKRRVFGTLTFTPTERITIRVSGEDGYENTSRIPPYTLSDTALAWLDNRNAKGISLVTFAPGPTPTAAQIALGVVGRTAVANATNRRYVYVDNDGVLFNSNSTFLTGSYNSAAVRSPSGEAGANGTVMRINDPSYLPYELHSGGPGMFRNQKLGNYTISADWRVLDRLNLNFTHNYQSTEVDNPVIVGTEPALSGDANTLRGVGGPANPYVGRLYIDGTWQNGFHRASYEESRLSLSYDFEPKPAWLGTHRLATMVSRSKDADRYNSTSLGFLGAPFNANATNANNLIIQRKYLDESQRGSYYAADWRTVPKSVTIGATSYDVGWINGAAGTNHDYTTQDSTSKLAVIQSHFLSRRLVTTFGYRTDDSDVFSYGFIKDPVLKHDIVDLDKNNPNAVKGDLGGITRTQGVVIHATPWLSLLGNWSSNIGVPTFRNRLLPDGKVPTPSQGTGSDYGFNLDLFQNKLAIRAVYFTTDEVGNTGSGGILERYNTRNVNVATAFESVLVGAGRPFTAAQWAPIRASLTPTVNATEFDVTAEGYEVSLVANPKPNWRLTANFSYTDRIRTNSSGAGAIPWYGFTYADTGLLVQGVTLSPPSIDPGAYTTTGTVARWLELGALLPAANPTTLVTPSTFTVAGEIYNIVSDINDDIQQNEQRWGLRPYKMSFFTAYDFSGRLKGFTAGVGYRWRSANIIGLDTSGKELKGRVLSAVDLMMRYSRKISDQTLTFQLNVTNLFNQDGILPQRFASTPEFQVPGGRGVGYSRFDFLEPRTVRFTTSLSF